MHTCHLQLNRHLMRAFTAVLILGALLACARLAQAMPDTASPGCSRRDTSVTLSADPAATRYRIAGWLCTPARQTSTVQLLLPGFTYTHTYWNPPTANTGWIDTATGAGHAVYLVDRIGTGDSGRPPADQVTVDSEAHITHQLVAALRDGQLGNYRTVVGIGHSFGSIVWMAEAGIYHDVDALVLTGMLHQLVAEQMSGFVANLHPAGDDPKFQHAQMPDGYLTTVPGTRATFFLADATATPGAARWDEAAKATGTSGELAFTPESQAGYSRQITAPVLAIVGARDTLLCSTELPCDTGTQLCERERVAYSATTPLFTMPLAQTGHSITQHRTAPVAAIAATGWIDGRPSSPSATTCRG